MQPIRIDIEGAAAVSATWFEAQVPAEGSRIGRERAVVVVAPALSTPQAFYAGFCRWLAAQGHDVLSFDYRGIESGSAAQARASGIDMETWLRVDVSVAIDEARRRAGGRPLLYVGHSLGGMALGATPGAARVDRAITIASGSGYPGLNPRSGRQLWLLGRVAMPLYTRLFGYFPGAPIRKVGNLPRGVALQWSGWLRRRGYWFDDPAYDMRERFASVRCPLLALSFSDDKAIQQPAVDDLHARYVATTVRRVHLAPAQAGLARIGHMGFFRRDAAALWPAALRWLEAGEWRLETPAAATP
ncbi:MAG TPA: alpha/beta hydrolase [Methylibium sp.]|uniref:alpha/beta hydrolase family protein n=1 Tax=Methylibium sp. TaxID=2067992 RepID=UPI002DBEEEBA|nr:alpha/beta hydrolase [Methylibium sp.]HEU4458997.1 alpha/beta hydrolase [Methylibium sp.]